MAPKVFVTSESDQAALAPLTARQSASLLMNDLPPVSYVDLSRYGAHQPVSGFCPRNPIMPHLGGGEVVVDKGIAEGRLYEAARARRLSTIYVHELAHRLAPGDAHGAVFAAVCCALTFRMAESESEVRKALGWYEVQDAENPGAALNHAIEFGRLHKDSGEPGENLPRLAAESWSRWRDEAWLDLLAKAKEWARARIESAESQSLLYEDKARRAIEAAALARVAAHAGRTLGWRSIAAFAAACGLVGWALGHAWR
jgi:hypothetical protein